jgi:hypothetical protein
VCYFASVWTILIVSGWMAEIVVTSNGVMQSGMITILVL